MRTLFAWTIRLVLLALLVALARRIIRSAGRTEEVGGSAEVLPVIVGDTWPPVPTNPDRAA